VDDVAPAVEAHLGRALTRAFASRPTAVRS
jgi:hypothetical protein